MNRISSHLTPALLVAGALLIGAAVAAAAPHSFGAALAGPALLVTALLAGDFLQRRAAHAGPMPSLGVLLMSTAIVVATGILALGDLDDLPGAVPLLGCCAVIPLVLSPRAPHDACRKA